MRAEIRHDKRAESESSGSVLLRKSGEVREMFQEKR